MTRKERDAALAKAIAAKLGTRAVPTSAPAPLRPTGGRSAKAERSPAPPAPGSAVPE